MCYAFYTLSNNPLKKLYGIWIITYNFQGEKLRHMFGNLANKWLDICILCVTRSFFPWLTIMAPPWWASVPSPVTHSQNIFCFLLKVVFRVHDTWEDCLPFQILSKCIIFPDWYSLCFHPSPTIYSERTYVILASTMHHVK